MVKRKWLWGKKSSERSSGESESSSSMSSHSDMFSNDQETLDGSPSMIQSQEVDSEAVESVINREETDSREDSPRNPSDVQGIDVLENTSLNGNVCKISVNENTRGLSDTTLEKRSKDCLPVENKSLINVEETQGVKDAVQVNHDKDDDDCLKLLTEKLSAALVTVNLKDDLVKQHSKVAEEAVAGWEKAENEAAVLKQQLEDEVQKRSTLEGRVSHLDEALRECVRQLRLAKDEQERKINQAVAEKTAELEIVKTRLEDQFVELQATIETSRMNTPDLNLQHKVDSLEKENIELRQEFQYLSEELEVRTIERDLSTKAAETASKQHLESIKKVARLEAECRKLKSLSRVSSSSDERKSNAAAASFADTLSDNPSDSCYVVSVSECDSRKINGSWASALMAELDQFKHEKMVAKTHHVPSTDINLMDDFLEMERLVALPDNGPQVQSVSCAECPEKAAHEVENRLRMELQSMLCRTSELEETIRKVEAEKTELSMTLAQARSCLEESQVQLIETQMKLDQFERELQGANEGEKFYKSLFVQYETETNLMLSQINFLRAEVEREQALSGEKSARCEELASELKKKEEEMKIQQNALLSDELKMKELALDETRDCLEKSEAQLQQAVVKVKELEKELQDVNEEKKILNAELESMREEVQKRSFQIESLTEQVQKEQALVAELSTKTKEMDYELERKTLELDAQIRANSNNELKIKQEDLAIAATKLADCQQTIASLGSQLKSLATLEDFLIDTASIPGFTQSTPLMARLNEEPWKLHSNGTYLSEKDYEPLGNAQEDMILIAGHNRQDTRGSPASSSSSSSAFFLDYPGIEKNRNGFAHYFSLSRS
ncbi:filament-like plant protein [Amaranthus tricolor]|uniref:filament-like plant protein n=1 Tax=Amaranthus tricolor TaxID=29722 RepID=UPI00258CFF6D|nr:filament-like plant protein [Amaranthus tricolor]XP_057532659.1 filament-like plant protein [Amaranthus tricolor]